MCLLGAFSVNAATPGAVSYFSANKYNLNHGDSVTLRWGKPSNTAEAVTYSIYVSKNGAAAFRWRSGLTSTSISRGGTTGILRSGTQSFDIVACNSSGVCGAKKSLTISIGGPPPVPNSFSVNDSSITQGQSISLSWAMHHNYQRATRYNLHVKKPGYSSFIFARNISSTQFSRTIDLAGTHTFYVEPCDASNGCGPKR
ncbi:MAG: hypothetical protein MJK04_13330, partial [Psychrosphaera sp.]|nr:hypothetical protein [Psychrosphaera sp.]